MQIRLFLTLSLAFLFPFALECQTSSASAVRFHTTLGDIDVTLLPDSAPQTVANFMTYVNSGAYNSSIVHRSVPGFVIQGGGFQWQPPIPVTIPTNPPVVNEFKESNTRGTLAMAKLGNDPNSATDQWFFNLSDSNAANLDTNNGGFTVFGRISNPAGLAVMDSIAAVMPYNVSAKFPTVPADVSSAFSECPLLNYQPGAAVQTENLVLVTSIDAISPPGAPTVSANGIITASGFGGYSAATPGTFIEIYGTDLAGSTRSWEPTDFKNLVAPTALEGVSVMVDGQPAYVNYVSPTQVNVEVPTGVTMGASVPIVLTYNGQSTAASMLPINAVQGGLLAPSTFNVNGTQYVTAIHFDTGAFVSNGSIPGYPAAPARRGEILIFYGIGFGAVSPSTTPIAGQIVTGTATVLSPVAFQFGDALSDPSAPGSFQGLAPNFVGLYQFNVTVPADAPSGDVALTLTQGGNAIAQRLYITVQ